MQEAEVFAHTLLGYGGHPSPAYCEGDWCRFIPATEKEPPKVKKLRVPWQFEAGGIIGSEALAAKVVAQELPIFAGKSFLKDA